MRQTVSIVLFSLSPSVYRFLTSTYHSFGWTLDCFLLPAPGGGVLVTYNVSEGLHLLGHPSNPPPYDEIVQVPPTQGPPPPYSSLDNLHMISAEPPPPPLGLGTRQLILTFLNENATQTQREAQGDWEEPETRVPLLDEPNAGTCGPTPLTPPPPAVSSMEEI